MKQPDGRFQRRIVAFLEGALSEREQRWFAKRLRQSDACRRELEAYRRLHELVAPPRVEHPSEYAMSQFLPRLHARIERDVVFRSRRNASWFRTGLLGLGVVEVCAAALLLVWGVELGRRPADTTAEPETPVVNQAQETETIRLIAETWVTPKLASRLATINPDREIIPYPTVSEQALPDTTTATTAPEAVDETTNPSSPQTVTDTSESYRRLIEVALPPSGIYGEEASYLLASRR